MRNRRKLKVEVAEEELAEDDARGRGGEGRKTKKREGSTDPPSVYWGSTGYTESVADEDDEHKVMCKKELTRKNIRAKTERGTAARRS